MSNTYCQMATTIICKSEQAAKDLVDILIREDADRDDYAPCSIDSNSSPNCVSLYAEKYFDTDKFIDRLTEWAKKYPDESDYFTYSFSCSRMRDDQFGGGAIAWANGMVQHFDPAKFASNWLNKTRKT